MAADTHIQAEPASDSAADEGSEPEIAAAMDQEAPEEVKIWTARSPGPPKHSQTGVARGRAGVGAIPRNASFVFAFPAREHDVQDEEVSPSVMRKLRCPALDLAILPIVA